jgi:hypothetical protein
MATGIGSGLSTQFGIETESTIGTPVAVTRFVEIDSDSLMADHTIAQGQGLRGNLYRRDARRVLVGRHAKGDVPFDLPTNGMGKILQHCLGSFSTTATVLSGTAYQQIHNTGSLQGKTFTAQKGIADTTGYIHPYTYPGAKVTSWEISAQPGGLVKFKLSIDAVDEVTESQLVAPTTLAASASAAATSISTTASIPAGTYISIGTDALTEYVTTGTPTGSGPYTIPITGTGTGNGLKYAHASGAPVGSSPNVYNSLTKLQTASYTATTGLFSFKDAHFVVGGTTSQVSGVWTNTGGIACTPANGIVIKNIDLKGSNALKVDRYGAGSQTVAEQLENGFRDITGSLDIEYNNRWFYDAYQVDQALALVMTFQNLDAQIGSTGKYPTVQFYLPAITFEDGASLQAPGPDVITQKLAFTALDDGTNGTLQAYVISTDTSV